MPEWPWLEAQFAGNSVRTWLVFLLLLGLGWLGGRLARFVLLRGLMRLAEKTTTRADEKIVQRIARPLQVLVITWMAHVGLQILDMAPELRSALDVADMGLFAATVALIVLRVIDVIFEEVIEPWAGAQNPPIHPQVIHLGQVVFKVVGATVAMVLVLKAVGFDVWSVITGLGIGGVAVALAAQQTLGNVFGSLQVLTDRPFRVGDWVRIDLFIGRVVQIGLRSTRLVNSAGLQLIVPNKHMAEANIENHTMQGAQVRDFTVQLELGTTSEQVRQAFAIVRAICAEHPLIADAPILTQLQAIGEWALHLRFVYHVTDPLVYGGVNSDVNLLLLERFAAAGLRFAVPVRQVQGPAAGAVAVQGQWVQPPASL